MREFDFQQLLETNKGKIYRICHAYAISPIEPQDLFQEVAYQIWKSLPSFQRKSDINTWIYRIALNVGMRSKLNLEKNKHKTVQYEAIQFKVADSRRDEAYDEKHSLLKECIKKLNEGDSAIIILYLEDLSYKQIAEITGLSENHIAVKMKRIRKKIFTCMQAKLN